MPNRINKAIAILSCGNRQRSSLISAVCAFCREVLRGENTGKSKAQFRLIFSILWK